MVVHLVVPFYESCRVKNPDLKLSVLAAGTTWFHEIIQHVVPTFRLPLRNCGNTAVSSLIGVNPRAYSSRPDWDVNFRWTTVVRMPYPLFYRTGRPHIKMLHQSVSDRASAQRSTNADRWCLCRQPKCNWGFEHDKQCLANRPALGAGDQRTRVKVAQAE